MSIRLNGSTSGYTTLDAPAVAGSNTIVLPSGNGSANQLLKNGSTAGTLGWSSMVEDSSQRLLVGTSTAYGQNYLQIQGDQTLGATGIGAISLRRGAALVDVGDNSTLGRIDFGFVDGGVGARIAAVCDATVAGTNDYPGRLVFSTTADGASSPTERMRIANDGKVRINRTTSLFTEQFLVESDTTTVNPMTVHNTRTGSATDYSIIFGRAGNLVGSIQTSLSATSYVTSSDYRLKENVVPLTGAADRLNQLQVHRFNFIADPDTTVDGFIAHEAQAVVPECVTGAKDEVDADGNPKYQGIDQSKLVPLLTAALQEALAKIDALESRIAALEVTP